MRAAKPVVGLPCDLKKIGGMPFHAVGEKYIEAIRDVVGAIPLLIPVTRSPLELADVLGKIDGLLLTGSASNVDPALYGGGTPIDLKALDTQRDATAIPLIKAAVTEGVPVFAICRGMQELNVALGGTLAQAVHDLSGRFDHREDFGAPEEVRYGPAHVVEVRPGGLIAATVGSGHFQVNSLHGQAIARLADGLAIEAEAEDGTIEAVSLPGGRGFVLGVQWHPEWRVRENPISIKIFGAFRDALKARRSPASG